MCKCNHRLALRSEDRADQVVLISEVPFLVGTAETCHLRLSGGDVSGVHACIIRSDGNLVLWDLSRNGTFILDASDGETEPRVRPVPKVKTVHEAETVDRDDTVPLVPGMCIAFSTKLWHVEQASETEAERPDSSDKHPAPPPPPKDGLAIEMVAGPDAGRLFPVEKLPVRLGRCVEKADLAFNAGRVSGLHALLLCDDRHRLWIEDMGSRNGTFVNGKEVVGRRRLKSGDLVDLGHAVSFCIHTGGAFASWRWRKAALLFAVGAMVVSVAALLLRNETQQPNGVIKDTDPDNPVVSWQEYLERYESVLPKAYEQLEGASACYVDGRREDMDGLVKDLAELPIEFNEFSDGLSGWLSRMEEKLAGCDAALSAFRDYSNSLRAIRLEQEDIGLQERFRSAVIHDNEEEIQKSLDAAAGLDLQDSFWAMANEWARGMRGMRSVERNSSAVSLWMQSRAMVEAGLQTWEASLDPLLASAFGQALRREADNFVEELRGSARQQRDAREKLLTLRIAQRILEDHERLRNDIEQLRSELEPVFMRELIRASGASAGERRRIAQAILLVTRPTDWTKTYHERALVLMNP